MSPAENNRARVKRWYQTPEGRARKLRYMKLWSIRTDRTRYQKAYRAAHLEDKAVYTLNVYWSDPEKAKARSREFHQAHKDEINLKRRLKHAAEVKRRKAESGIPDWQMGEHRRRCAECKQVFIPKARNAKYCPDHCYDRRTGRRKSPPRS